MLAISFYCGMICSAASEVILGGHKYVDA